MRAPIKRITHQLHIMAISMAFLSLSACSQNRQFNELKQDYKNHHYSKYVSDNLRTSSASAKIPIQANNSTRPKRRKQLTAIQHQLAGKKQRSTAHIRNTLYHNGLFTPNRSLQKELTQLSTPSTTEAWLAKKASLATVLALALKNNLTIQSNLQSAQSSLAKYDQMSFLDDTLSQYAAFTKDLKITTGTKKHNKPVSNNFPFPGLLAIKASIIDQSVETARLQLKQSVQDVLTETQITYYELQLARQENNLVSRSIKLLQSLKNQLKDSYSTSTTDLGSILDIDIQIAKNRNQRQLVKNRMTAKQAQLNTLLNLSPAFTFNHLEPLQPAKLSSTVSSLIQRGKQHRVEIERLQSEIKKTQRIIQLSEKRFYPDISAGYSRFQNQTRLQTGSNAIKPAFSTRPAFAKKNFFATNDAYLRETQEKLQALKTKLSALLKQTEGEIQQVYSNYQSEKNNRSLYRSKIIPKTKASLEIAQNLFETGDASYAMAIKLEKQIQDSRLLALKATKEMNINTAKLARLVGQSHHQYLTGRQ